MDESSVDHTPLYARFGESLFPRAGRLRAEKVGAARTHPVLPASGGVVVGAFWHELVFGLAFNTAALLWLRLVLMALAVG